MRRLEWTLVAIMTIASVSFAGGRFSLPKRSTAQSFAGEIFDSPCAMMASHAQMQKMNGMGDDSKMCALKCVEAGGKFVLYDFPKKISYQLDNQEKARQFAGHKVKVIGTYNAKSRTIHVLGIEATP